MARPAVPSIGDPEWGTPLINAIFEISDKADDALEAAGGGGGFTGGVTSNDVEITDATKGYILKSPNGSRWRITVGNDGAITSTSL